MIRIILTDDHSIVRDGLKKILEEEEDMKVVGEAKSAEELMILLKEIKADVLLLDISLPGKNGMEIIPEIIQAYPDLLILMLSMHSEEKYAIRALKSGAAGYVAKDAASDDLVEAIHSILKGTYYISEGESNLELKKTPPENLLHNNLSTREYQIMILIAKGKNTATIAMELTIEPSTVATFRGRILKKLGLESSIEIANYVRKKKLR